MIKTLKTVFTKKTHEGATERLLQYAFSYFGLYVNPGDFDFLGNAAAPALAAAKERN